MRPTEVDTPGGFHCPRSSAGYVPVHFERVSLRMPRQVHCTHITTKCYVYTCTYIKGQTKLTFTWHTPNRVNIK